MTFATHANKRNSRRSIALVSALAVLMSLMTIYATPAQAHHPTTTASQICVDGEVFISFTSTSWQLGEPGHPDVRVEVSVNGGSWTEVGAGSYSSGNGYSFSGTFAAAAYWGESIKVRSQVQGNWPNGAATGNGHPAATTAAFTVNQDCFNPSCPSDLIELKLEGGSLTSGTHGPNDEFTIDINGTTFDWTSTVPVFQVIAKGGPSANVYNYPGGGFADQGLHAPTNPNNGKNYGLSHISLCYQEGGQDDPVEVTVTGGECLVDQQGVGTGSATVQIDPDSKATVEIFDDPAMQPGDKVGETSSSGTVDGLPPGTYHWKATAADGYELQGSSEGTFTISDCGVSVVVTAGVCAVGQQGTPAGSAEVTIDPNSGATVTIYTNSDMTGEVASVTESGSVDGLAPGTYYWTATASDGFGVSGEETGQFTIEPCEVTVNATGSCEVVDNAGVGTIEITVSVPGSVSLEIPGVGTFDESDSATVAAGATYPWSATPNAGFTISGDSSGEIDIEDCTPPTEVGASILVTVDSSCVVVDDQGQGVIDVVVSVDDGATVVIRDSSGEVVETLTSDGSVTVMAGATYTWEAAPNTGFEFPPGFVASGSLDIEDCTPTPTPPPPTPDEVMASILVTVDSFCEDGDGFVDVDLSVAGGATVVVSDSDGDVMGRLTADGTITVPEGATYTWVATPSEGFEFPPGFVASGTITIASCSDPETLPFTGMDLDVAAAFAAAFLGAGITVLASQWRREEQ